MTLADMCYQARKAMKLTQWEMALQIESNQTEISFIERGFTPRAGKKIAKIEELYKTYVEEA